MNLFSIPSAHAQYWGREGATAVAGYLGGVAGGDFGDIAVQVADAATLFVNAAAIISIVIAGMLAVIAQDENRIATARKVIIMSLVGIVLINIANRIAMAFLIGFNVDQGADPGGAGSIIETELFGILNFVETFVVIFAIIAIIVYGIKAVVDYGGEQGQQAFRKAIVAILLGIILIVTRFILAGAIVTGNPEGIVDPAMNVLYTIVGFVALIAVVVIAIAGIYLIVNLGDENRAEKAKKIIISVTVGLIFMAVIGALLAVLVDGLFGGGTLEI